jgi:DNA-binding transcriptional MerR regulator
MRMFTVKEISELAGVSARTLHYYDEIGLLKPVKVGDNGYRYYDEPGLLRLQQILFYRELDMDLKQIKRVLDDPKFDLVTALQQHRAAMQQRGKRLEQLIKTIDKTILHLVGEVKMSEKNIFKGFSEEKQKEYEKQAAENWGEDQVKQSVQLWNSYSDEKKAEIMKEGGDNYSAIVANMHLGPQSDEVQALLVKWHEHMYYFYEPSLDVLRGLGNAYNESPDFNATFTAFHPDLPAFLQQAINFYVDELEDQWLRKELGILEDKE